MAGARFFVLKNHDFCSSDAHRERPFRGMLGTAHGVPEHVRVAWDLGKIFLWSLVRFGCWESGDPARFRG